MGRISQAANRLRYRQDDPLRDLHVPKRQRLDTDEGVGGTSDASDGGADYPEGEDADEIRANTEIVDRDDLA